jgi:arginine deiminase
MPAREQWDDGCNLLAVEPGVCWPTSATSRPTHLRRNGIEVITIRGSSAVAAVGRCMSCPISATGSSYPRPGSGQDPSARAAT